ncbi:MAG: RNA 2',3'-cyclic phosphodiesterase [Candidatus Bathyarchaeota archaeon]|jgi:2'-5' RNA ligase|nr:RNA 2',3'-cyclic phosphodiesterase [Candidatus Bathyarchaeota archaeon]MDD4326239.1 RNA 2',3'-cyclic phosphodiesterase [Candidatus Bathyarchaeota archaeon]MDI9578384.1 RNA 2',3'-cyclic phosphodiesterase [Thermoproteota archaeon]MDT8782063.1 RNA 2',3'-cyclic phosphodiesterase [Candidatus Bathyarchaeota archaeon]NLD66412.1 RNA 2',3'-cyclic phosphodiesterase [Thermoproteota archaeon]
MSEQIRSFVAFDIENDSVKSRIAAAQKMLIQTNADLKLVEPKNIHVTIRFLGAINPEMIDQIYTAMKNIKYTPFNIQLNGLGVFPTVNYPKVVWAGITAGAQELRSIFEQLEPQIHELGIAPDPKGFTPHLTIARVRSGANKQRLVDLVTRQENYDFGNIRADCLKLKKSELLPAGPKYTTLKEYCP